ncbi:ExbD/TolR family protein [Solitalea lacus]|uniref:ExbD/TolR family protein n=1 Tax=Solitalea lacus TaxID=2911172 RepID=UPI001EDB29E7|nr:biopolymer transporter ExbD [Solitalea lacus]UKJ07726.1 biopolymer transporter ExbD [Solitalea lacus]
MGKVKVPRKSTMVDMTAMTDVAFLLLTFFMLATQFKPEEAVVVDTPSSISEIKLPDTKVILISVDKGGRIFFGLEGTEFRKALLDNMAAKRQISFTPAEKEEFSKLANFGTPMNELKSYLAMSKDQRKKYNEQTKGVPCDSTQNATNELKDWLIESRRVTNSAAVIAIKGDRESNYPVVKNIIATLQAQKANRFNFITNMEQAPNL